MHPVQHDLRGSVPASGHVAGHLVVGVPRQAKVQDLERKGAMERERNREKPTIQTDWVSTWRCAEDSGTPTFSSQSSFTARLLGFKSCKGGVRQTWRKMRLWENWMLAFVSESKDDSQRSVKKKKHCIIYILCQALSLFFSASRREKWVGLRQRRLTLWMMSAEWMYCRGKKMCIQLQNEKMNRQKKRLTVAPQEGC